MASQPVTNAGIDSFSFDSFVYMDCWNPCIGEVLPLERDQTNLEDQCAVAIKKSGVTVGHVPFNLAPVVSAFLRRSSNIGLMEVTGNRVNGGAGYELEVQCKYHFYGSTLYIATLKTIVRKQQTDGLL